ncbi:NDP-hexose 2,3-dehydratase family protein [Amycolatopsis suaedae]|uniref:NDP-hexose 2,3-dehydratase n=1 Tax=Amycolatopsis suaedae TaxID=2510978 RepID=A0A4Q7J6P0_9PSEU|nr:NDP-hexose 2,3-dehydratase family protein [Amycolatopsis suaedae]RZQ62506.1 NDP-hexose 2,3-dehydratase [Amycolatopsis suaedae]
MTAGRIRSRAEFDRWWAGRHAAGRFEVTRIGLDELTGWHFDDATGNLVHDSGRFFSVEGIEKRVGGEPLRSQPVIHQPEIGVLGIVVADFDGERHCLLQAKMEPGNVNILQLSPTVQATRSNYTKVHRGARTRYLELFTGPRRGRVLVDVLQSEQGAWFWRKRNRNIVVEVDGAVHAEPATDDYRWIPLSLVWELLRTDNLVNMDARTVLSCLPEPVTGDGATAGALHSDDSVLSWFTEAKTWCDWHARLVPLNQVRSWRRTPAEIAPTGERDFRIIGVRVTAGNREVSEWTQPLLEPAAPGLAVFVVRRIHDVPHVLVQALPEIGLLDLVEMAPTIQLTSAEDAADIPEPLLKDVATGGHGQVRYDTLLSEEGGRFHHALTRYQIVEVGDDFPVEVPPQYRWLTTRQLIALLRHGHYLNIEARSLVAYLHAL